MNSFVEKPKFKNFTVSKKNFKHDIGSTDITTSIEVEVLERIELQDLNTWVKNIKELIQNNKYSKIVNMAIIRSMLSVEYKNLIKDIKDPGKALEKKIQYLKYNSSYAMNFKFQLGEIKQIKYFLIEEYFEKLE
ncbi:hypothetical protein DMUE_0232 [Dictyocoela muelleri]|nr:hypothetical protein DMUE_0232 [Dictyocoela muelleri]